MEHQCGTAPSLTSNTAVCHETTNVCVFTEWHAVLLQSKILVTSLINGSKLQIHTHTHRLLLWFTPPWLTHSIIIVMQTSKLRLCPVLKCCCRAKPQLQCITNSHICTLSKLAVWHIRISQIANYSIPSSYSHWICMSCLLLRSHKRKPF